MAGKKKARAKAPDNPQDMGQDKAPPTTPQKTAPQSSPTARVAARPPAPKATSEPSAPRIKPPSPGPRRSPIPSEDLLRPDPDQPPVEGVAARPSVYSEWLNQSTPAPDWLNSPPPRKPSPTARRRAAAKAAQPEDPMQQVLNDQPAPPPAPSEIVASSVSRPTPRRRTTARRITDAEHQAITSTDLEALLAGRAPTTVAMASPAPQRVTTGHPAAVGPRPTTGHAPTTGRRFTTGHPAITGLHEDDATDAPPSLSPARPTTAPGTPPVSAPGAGPTDPRARATGYHVAAPSPHAPQTSQARGQTAERLAPPRATTGAHLPAVPTPDPSGPPAERPQVDSQGILIRGSRRPPTTTGPVAPHRKGPHPVLVQALVVVCTIGALLTAVMVTSPLGYGAALSGTFQAYANAVPWVPTPTPTPKPAPFTQNSGGTSISPGQQVVINDIKAVFGQYASGALNIARCESGYDPNARNPFAVGSSHAEGVFQILFPSTWDTTSYRNLNPYDYDANIHAAYEIFSRDGYSWREWECQP